MKKLRYGKARRNGVRPVIWTNTQLRFIKRSYEEGLSLRAIAKHFGLGSHSRITVVCRENGWTRTKKSSPSAVFRRFLLRNPDLCLKIYAQPGWSASMAAKKIARLSKAPFSEELSNVMNRWLSAIDAKKDVGELNRSNRVYDKKRLASELSLKEWLNKPTFKTYKQYLVVARRISIILFSRWDKHLPELRYRHLGLVVDHKFSIAEGFKRGVALRIICHPANLQTVTRRYNLRKGNACDISLKALKKKIRQFDGTYGDPFTLGDKKWLKR